MLKKVMTNSRINCQPSTKVRRSRVGRNDGEVKCPGIPDSVLDEHNELMYLFKYAISFPNENNTDIRIYRINVILCQFYYYDKPYMIRCYMIKTSSLLGNNIRSEQNPYLLYPLSTHPIRQKIMRAEKKMKL